MNERDSMTENDYIAEYVKERHPEILSLDYVAWRVARAASEFGISMKEAISRIYEHLLEPFEPQESEDVGCK